MVWNRAGQIKGADVGNEKLIQYLKESIAFFENELREFKAAQEKDEALMVQSENRAQWRERLLSVRYYQEFIDSAQESLEQYQARLKEVAG
jgi:hypothetical protein